MEKTIVYESSVDMKSVACKQHNSQTMFNGIDTRALPIQAQNVTIDDWLVLCPSGRDVPMPTFLPMPIPIV